MEIIDLAEQAYSILHSCTLYYSNKDIIKNIFSLKSYEIRKEILRLTIIDSFYSTNLKKRSFGIEEIATGLKEISQEDCELNKLAKSFSSNPSENSKIFKLINSEYGYNQNFKKFGKASSLITKYLYFLTDYQFPIYDSLALNTYNLLSKKYPDLKLKKLNKNCDITYFKALNELNENSDISNFEKLDNLLWICGKIIDKNYSLIYSMEESKKIINDSSLSEMPIRNYNKILDEHFKTNYFALWSFASNLKKK